MGFQLGWRSTFRRGKIYTQIKEGVKEAELGVFLGAIACFSVALENIEKEEILGLNKIDSFRHWLDPNEKEAAYEELLTYCKSTRGIVYSTLIGIFLDMGDKESAIEFFNRLKKANPQRAEKTRVLLQTQGIELI